MGRAADGDAGGGRHRAPGGLPRRPAAGAAQVRADLEYRAAHRAPGPDGHGWSASLAVLLRVRDALASGGRP
jgi:hypothetical protein